MGAGQTHFSHHRHRIIGRDSELATIRRWCAEPSSTTRAVILEGEAGVGKSTVWAAGGEAARAAGWTVLSARGSETETGLSFAGLTDLLDPVIDEVLDDLPEPQRLAVEVALIRRAADGNQVGPREIGAGVLGALRHLCEKRPVLLAIDDMPWLDSATLSALRFALRRLNTSQIRVLASRRITGGIGGDENQPGEVPQTIPLDDADVMRLGPLAAEVIGALLVERYGLTFPDRTVRRLAEQAGGNPFWALELGAALTHAGAVGDNLPIPPSLASLVARRLDELEPSVREVMFVASMLEQPTIALAQRALAAVVENVDTVIDRAVAAGVIAESGGRLRPSHPLLGSAAISRLPPLAKAALHRRLAQAVTDPEQRARHIALAASGEPDESVATALDEGTEAARSRGATRAAAELADRAVEFTPPTDVAASTRRRMTAAELYLQAGDHEQARACADAVWHTADAVNRRRALPLLVEATYWTRGAQAAEQFVAPLVDDPRLDVHTRAVVLALAADVGDGRGTPRAVRAQRALDLFEEVEEPDPLALSIALAYLAFAKLNAGEGIAVEEIARVEELQRELPYVVWSQRVSVVVACWHKDVDDIDGSRIALTKVIDDAVNQGEDAVLPTLYGHLALTETWAGRYASAREAITHAWQWWGGDGPAPTALKSTDALLHILTGDFATARKVIANRIAEEGEASVGTQANPFARLIGLMALLEGDDERAFRELSRSLDNAREAEVYEPGRRHRIEGDLGQALVNTGRLDDATALAEEQLALGQRTGRPTLIGVARRIEGLVLASQGDLDAAATALNLAVAEHERSPLPLESGRSLLALGQVQRRRRAKAEARQALQAALECFTALGAKPFTELARVELGMGRRARDGSVLTPAEQRVADLVAEGLTNREVASRLFASVRTVETHLAAVYRKLEVRSRSELTALLTRRSGD
jgi:DNA-binding CsgD family transcriptional regulator